MKLNLNNPILIFDIETTGLDVATDRIVEISIIKIFPDGKEEVKTKRINPGVPIPEETTMIHGIADDDVKNCPTFKEIAKSLYTFMDDCDLVGYNSFKFDIPLLVEEFLRAGINIDFRKRKSIDVQNIYHKMEPRTLSAAYKFYCNKVLTNAHSAEADTRATYEVLQAQIEHYPELQNDVKYLSEFSIRTRSIDYAGRVIKDKDGEPIFNFGKHKGRKVKDIFTIEPVYYSWIMNGDFTLDTKRVFTDIRLSMK